MEINPKTPSQWRYTWEAQSHSPNLRLFLFDCRTNPRLHCKSLSVSLIVDQFLLLVTWVDDGEGRDETKGEVSLRVSVPRVLIDSESPVAVRGLDDHIEVKLVLLLPVDHPVVSGFHSLLPTTGEKESSTADFSTPLVMDSDAKTLSSMEEVHFHCRNCSTRLTRKGLRNFSEMPSVNWQESADNWFGDCCCSFGQVSEKIVAKYTNSYACSTGLCLLSDTTVLLSKDDLEDCLLSKINFIEKQGLSSLNLNDDLGEVNKENGVGHENQCETGITEDADHVVDKAMTPECCIHGSDDIREMQLAPDKKFLLNGFLQDVFMARASNASRNVKWVELGCSNCSSVVGVYPSTTINSLTDGGVRLFKCYISTSSTDGSNDVFRKYTLERMFASQLVEYAKDELSFQVVVKDLTTKSPLFQIVVLNPNTWSSNGVCSSNDGTAGSRTELYPVVKVLFSYVGNSPNSLNRVLGKKHEADDVFVLKRQGEKLKELLSNANKLLPPSCGYLEGSRISSIQL